MTRAKRTIVSLPDAVPLLRAVAMAASKDEARPVLTAVHMFSRSGDLYVESTDAYRIHRGVLRELGPAGLDVLVPAAWLVRSLPKRRASSIVDLEFSGGRVTLHDKHTGESCSAPLIKSDLPFPIVDKVLAAASRGWVEVDGSSDQRAFNPALLADVLKACQLFSDTPVRVLSVPPAVEHNDRMSPWMFDVDDDPRRFTALLMPVRVPGWSGWDRAA